MLTLERVELKGLLIKDTVRENRVEKVIPSLKVIETESVFEEIGRAHV